MIVLFFLPVFTGNQIPPLGDIKFGNSLPQIPTFRDSQFKIHLNHQYGLVVHEMTSPKSLYEFEHDTRIRFRIMNPVKAYQNEINSGMFAGMSYHVYCKRKETKYRSQHLSQNIKDLSDAWKNSIQLTDFEYGKRHKKQAALAAFGIGALISYYGTQKYKHYKEHEAFQNRILQKIDTFESNFNSNQEKFFETYHHNLEALQNYFCELDKTSSKLATRAVRKYTRAISKTINQAINNELPFSTDSIKRLVSLCLMINKSSPLPYSKLILLCNNDVRSHLRPTFMGFSLFDDDIIIHFDVKLFNYAKTQISTVLKVNNLGYFNNDTRVMLNVPDVIYRTTSGSFITTNCNSQSPTPCIHQPENVINMKNSCAGNIIINNKLGIQTCVDQGELHLFEEPLTNCRYAQINYDRFLISGPGRFFEQTEIKTITENSVTSFGSFECDVDQTIVHLNKVEDANLAPFKVLQLDSRYLTSVPKLQLTNLTTTNELTSQTNVLSVHHSIHYGLALILMTVLGCIGFFIFNMRSSLNDFLQKKESSINPTNQFTLRKKSKSLNDITNTSDSTSTNLNVDPNTDLNTS